MQEFYYLWHCLLEIVTLFPERKGIIVNESVKYFIEMLLIIPAVMLSIGLFSVWISKEQTSKYLGKESGLKGALISIIIGFSQQVHFTWPSLSHPLSLKKELVC